MSEPLRNKTILVTRPAMQAADLCALIEQNGGLAIHFPVIEIRAKPISESLKKSFETINDYNMVIFVSQNAVTISFDYYLARLKRELKNICFVTIGESTARVLQKYQVNNIIHAGKRGDSESLLSLFELSEEAIKGKDILIIRGTDGRELLADTLRTRGATVNYLEVYQRYLPEYEINEKRKIWQKNKPDAIIITSSDSLDNLFALTVAEDKALLCMTPLIVMSERMINRARQRGSISTIQHTNEKTDEGLVKAVIDVIRAT